MRAQKSHHPFFIIILWTSLLTSFARPGVIQANTNSQTPTNRNTITVTQSIHKMNDSEQELLAVYEVFVDLRHLSDYNNSFEYERHWELILKYTLEGQEGNPVLIVIDTSSFPEPTGFFLTQDVPLSFLYMLTMKGKMEIVVKRQMSNFLTQKVAFENCVFIRKLTQFRPEPNNKKAFFTIIENKMFKTVKQPQNFFVLPDIDYQKTPLIISSGASFDIISANTNAMTGGTGNLTIDTELDSYFALPYLPYFMKCGGKGNYVFFSSVSEHNKCELPSLSQMDPVSDFDFGKKPKADTCKTTFKCKQRISKEDMKTTETNLWLLSNINTVLFYFYEDPVDHAYFTTNFQVKKSLNSEKFVAVKVRLRIGYLQEGAELKRIVNSSVVFSGFEIYNDKVDHKIVDYALEVDWMPLSHTELTIEFALTWRLYLVLFLAIGIIALIMVLLFGLFHLLTSRKKKNYFFVGKLFKLVWVQAFVGISYIHLVLIVYYAFTGFLCLYKLMNFSFKKKECTGSELDCARYAPWDFVIQDKFKTPDALDKLRKFRFGCCQIHFGIFVLVKNSRLMYGKESKSKQKRESFDRNVWLTKLWHKVNFVAYACVLLIIELYLVHFSFTKKFADNVWVFLVVYKCIGIFVSTVLSEYAQDILLAGIYGAVVGIIENLSTLGAANFLDFLQSNLIVAGIQMFERIYLAPIIDVISEWLKQKFSAIKEFLINLTMEEQIIEHEDFKNEAHQIQRQDNDQLNQNDPENSSGSEILITDEDKDNSLILKKIEDLSIGSSVDFQDNRRIFQKKTMNDLGSRRSSRHFSSQQKKTFARNIQTPLKPKIYPVKPLNLKNLTAKIASNYADEIPIRNLRSAGKKNPFFYSQQIKHESKNLLNFNPTIDMQNTSDAPEREQEMQDQMERNLRLRLPISRFKDKIQNQIRKKKHYEEKARLKKSRKINSEEKLNREQFESASDKFSSYMDEVVVQLVQPFFVWMSWAFYSEINVGSGWGIKNKNFIYYFLFVITYTFFQMFMDIIYFHIEYYFHGRDITGVLQTWKKRFLARKHAWLGSSKEDLSLSHPKRLAYKFQFSSQSFFVRGLAVAGFISIILGIMTVIHSNQNPFDDLNIIVVLIANHVLMEILKWLFGRLGHCLGIWAIKRPTKPKASGETQSIFYKNQYIKDNLRISSFGKVEDIRKEKNRVQLFISKLEATKFEDVEFQHKFLNHNKCRLTRHS